jgi:hypothetical protein
MTKAGINKRVARIRGYSYPKKAKAIKVITCLDIGKKRSAQGIKISSIPINKGETKEPGIICGRIPLRIIPAKKKYSKYFYC